MFVYLVLANLFARFTMELFDTDEESMQWNDFGLAVPKSQVQIKAVRLAA